MKKESKKSSLLPFALLLLASFSIGHAKSVEYPGASGKPFQNIQEQIDQLETSLQDDISALQTRLQLLEAETANLRSQVDASMGDIDTLTTRVEQNELMITMLQAQLNSLKSSLSGGCPKDYALRQVLPNGTVVCEYDNGTNSTIVSVSVEIPDNQRGSAFAPCPSGYQITGGGHWAPTLGRYFVVNQSLPFSNGWMTSAFNTMGDTRTLEAYAICERTE